MKTLLNKTYTSEELSDLSRDIHEAFDERFTPAAAGIPKDEHGFHEGTFTVSIVWKGEEEDLPILGYLPGGKRIHPIGEGMIASAAVVSCCGCHKVIRGMGGPMSQALCPDCWEAAGL